ncbi:GNS1/SUR4 family protein [Necator americanus]|uniref:Elongation of very long chain fatty acids protein n=1 Tax=Necator americanus TaxID=51031 RepID=W2TSF8_NECAM|nr:GNS1/SUR4 family protein [Necator americanus]ETN83952.1 GNS1/SUR4 family protein [Necator americanus]
MEHPLVQRLADVKFDTRRFLSLVTHGGKNFPDKEGRKWVADHFDITIQLSILYVVVVFGLRHIMRKREPFSLFVPLNIWNFTLAVFSIIGTIKLTPEFWNTLFDKGLQNSYCYAYDFTKGDNGYWVFLFIVSKIFELVDTVFIVLRKRPLMFLHWYHHILTAVYAFYSHPHTPGFNRYGIYLNFTVHAFMYSYYFLRSMKISLPGLGTIAKFITTLQIFQFVVSCAILVHIGYLVNIAEIPCDFDSNIFVLAMFMDTTYLILFINFFLQSYVLRGGKDKYKSVPADSKKKR